MFAFLNRVGIVQALQGIVKIIIFVVLIRFEMSNRKEIISTVLLLFIILAFAVILYTHIVIEGWDWLTNPQLIRGQRFLIKTLNGEYLTSCRDCKPNDQNLTNKCSSVLCLSKYPLNASVFIYEPYRDGTFAIRVEATDKYWKRCTNCVDSCEHIICTDGINPTLQSAKFVLIKNDDSAGSVSIKCDNGGLIELNNCDQSCGKVVAAIGLGINSQFIIEPLMTPQNSTRTTSDTNITSGIAPYAPQTLHFNSG